MKKLIAILSTVCSIALADETVTVNMVKSNESQIQLAVTKPTNLNSYYIIKTGNNILIRYDYKDYQDKIINMELAGVVVIESQIYYVYQANPISQQ